MHIVVALLNYLTLLMPTPMSFGLVLDEYLRMHLSASKRGIVPAVKLKESHHDN